MAGGAKATTAAMAGPSAPRSITAPMEFQNEVDASSLYQLLENQIVPLYYAKPDGKLPLAWLRLIANRFAALRRCSTPNAWSRNTQNSFIFPPHRHTSGTFAWSYDELRNTSKHGADMLLLQNFRAPYGYDASDLVIHMTSVETATYEGFLVYGVNFKSERKEATLLAHVFGEGISDGWYHVGTANFAKYCAFAVSSLTMDPSARSSLGNRTELISTAKKPAPLP